MCGQNVPRRLRQNCLILATKSGTKHEPVGRADDAPGRVGHWWEVLTRTWPGRLVLLLTGVAMIGLITSAVGHFVLGAFPSYGEALWSSIAHLVDPGSIGDDESPAKRSIGLLQVIAGMIFFAGIVLTVLTEVVDRALRRLEKGDPAVRRSGHVLVVGFNSSLWEIQKRLRSAARDEPPEIVVMLTLDEADRRDETRGYLADYPARTTVVVAEPAEDGYGRVCATQAKSIVLLSPVGDPDSADLEVTDRASLLRSHLEQSGAKPTVAVEFRRGRNVQAFWMDGREGTRSRFPGNFDALVNDRNIGAILAVAVMNSVFAEFLFDDWDGTFAPELLPVDGWAKRSYGEARAGLVQFNLLGIVTGSGPEAQATYLPGPDRMLEPGDRLIVVPTEVPEKSGPTDPLPDAVKVVPARPGPVLVIGWSDASSALASELASMGAESGVLHLLDLEPPDVGKSGERVVNLIEGEPSDPSDIAHAIDAVDPQIIWVSAEDSESAAIVRGMLARQVSEVPILVEQAHDDQSNRNERVAEGLTVVATGGIVAESVALSLGDPAILVAREGMVNNPNVILESLTYVGNEPLALSQLREAFAKSGAVPLAILLEESETHLHSGDHILAFHRTSSED